MPPGTHREIRNCRACGNTELAPVLDLGEQALTGVFPKSRDQSVRRMPLQLVKCVDEKDADRCGLLQLRHTADASEMYGTHYGYRSGLNPSMVAHLRDRVKTMLSHVTPGKGDLVIDIGSNDGTTLGFYPDPGPDLVGIDPTGAAFRRYYPERVRLIPDFFSAKTVRAALGSRRAKVITSFAMFYDLETPLQFMREIHECLEPDGIWMFEQSYLPTMLDMNSYDTVCHEHLEYYGFKPICWMAERAGFRILDVEFNAVNGGSFCVTVAKAASGRPERSAKVTAILRDEEARGLQTLRPYQEFAARVRRHRDELRAFLSGTRHSGRRVFGFGASTKGNVLLQYCDFGPEDLPYIAEVNADKFGSFTPGTLIPIIAQEEALGMKPDMFLVLPWHFRNDILARRQDFLGAGGRFVFPLPTVEVVGRG
ncbi:MAG TPA: class I SAM-dependent methyltransferase [Verrucomicrobiae bacterium]|nr:class I SAM-dependent methyltransferase [Verrucomicrobiae bacterium]